MVMLVSRREPRFYVTYPKIYLSSSKLRAQADPRLAAMIVTPLLRSADTNHTIIPILCLYFAYH